MTSVLVIEDDDLVRGTLRQILEDAGYEVDEAAEGREGIKRYKEKRADLVLTDIIMPEKEGIETILELRRYDPKVKIIAISGGGRIGATDYLRMAARLGADDVIAKPFDANQLLQAVRGLLTVH